MSFEFVGPLAGHRPARSRDTVIRVEETRPFPGGLAFGLQRVAVSQADQAARAALQAPLGPLRPHTGAQQGARDSHALGWLRSARVVDSEAGEEERALLGRSRPRSRLDTFVCSLACTGAALWLALLLTMYYGFWVLSDYMHYANEVATPNLG